MSKPTPTTRTGLFIALDEVYLRLLQALQSRPEYAGHSLEDIAAAVVYRRAVELFGDEIGFEVEVPGSAGEQK